MDENIVQEIVSSVTITTDSLPSLKLSPNDWILPASSTINCIYFYDIRQWSLYEKQSNNDFINTRQLISSLRKLIEYYPLLTGTLQPIDKINEVSIEHKNNQGGVLFVSTIVNIPLSVLPLSVEKYINIKILPEKLELINTVNSGSLYHIRHTRFTCGSVALGISLNHQVADAHSYFQLVKDWTQFYRNPEYQSNVCHERSLLQPTITEIQTLKSSNANFHNQKSLFIKKENTSSTPTTTTQNIIKLFRFSADELHRMKTDAMASVLPNVSYLSTFEVLTAHLYRHIMLARNSTTSSLTKLYIAINTRSRLTSPSIPWTYFGNAIMLSYLEMNTKEVILENSLGSLASKAHKSIEENTSNDIRTSLAWITCQEDKSKIVPSWNLDTDFTVSAWNKMGMYSDSDFELGVYSCRIMLSPDLKMNGGAIYFSTEKQDSGIDVFLGLAIHEMEQLEKNVDFRRYSIR